MLKEYHSRSGQAMAELLVAIVSLVVLFAGIIQISILGLAQTRVMIEARRLAAVKAMGASPDITGARYISELADGADDVRYSADDGAVDGSVALFRTGIVSNANPDQLSSQKPNNPFSTLYTNDTPQYQFGFVCGEASVWVTLTNFPVVTNLLYQANGVGVTGRVWLTWTKLY